MRYEEIDLDIRGISVRLKITNPVIIESYKTNPERVKNYFSVHITESIADIESEEGLDTLIAEIALKALSEKVALLKNSQQER